MTTPLRLRNIVACGAALAALGLAAVGCGPNPTPLSHSTLPALVAGQLPLQTRSTTSSVSPIYKVVFYIPNRIVDLIDIVSFGIGIPSVPYLFPSSIHANAHVSRGFQAGVGTTHGLFLGKSWSRDFAWALNHTEFSVGPLTVTELKHTAQTSAEVEKVGILVPSDAPFAERRMDYWAVGAHAGLLPVAASVDVHPVELLDAVLGFLFIDILDDDYLGSGSRTPPSPAPAAVPPPPQ